MSIGSLQLVRTWGLIVQDGSPGGSQRGNLRPRRKPTTLGTAFLISSSDLGIGRSLVQDGWSTRIWHHVRMVPRITPSCSLKAFPLARASMLSVAEQSKGIALSNVKAAGLALIRGLAALQGYPLVVQCAPAVALMAFSVWGLGPTMRLLRRVVKKKEDGKWDTSRTQHVIASYIRPICLWVGVIIICRAFDPVVLSSETSHAIKHRFINFVRSLSTVLAFAFCTASLTQQIQKTMMESHEKENSRSLGLQFVGNTVYTSVWVAAVCLFMELLGFSTQKWITAGGFGTVLLTLAGREIFTNFLSSIMIHATRPFVENEWIQTKIEGQEVSGTVEHVGWWSPTVIRGDDREAVHIPNHKFTVSVVRNLSQKTHWRIKTHFGISHLDVGKITYIVADMRKVIAKHPQVEQQRLHRRAFFDNVDPENQALLILVSCFVKTSHFEEYLRVKEVILLDLLRVISHHNARLATPIRSVQRILDEQEARQTPFRDMSSSHDRRGPRYMIEAAAVAVNDNDEAEMVRPDTVLQTPEIAKENVVKDFGKENKVKEVGKDNVVKEFVTDNTGREMVKENGIITNPAKGIQSMDEVSDVKTKTKTKEKATEVSSKSGGSSSTENPSPPPITKPQLEGLDSMGLNSNDITLLKAAFEKPPVDIPEGPVDSGEISRTEKVSSKSPLEQDKPPKMDSSNTSNEPAEQLASVNGLDLLTNEQLDDDPWREQPQVLNQPISQTASPKQDIGQSEVRSLEEAVQTAQVQGQAQVSNPAPVPRLKSVEENLVLGVALDGPKRTLPLDDDDIQPPAKPRELVTSRNASGGTPSKDRRDPPSNPQQNPSGSSSFDGRDRER